MSTELTVDKKQNSFQFNPIGYVYSSRDERYMLPRQPKSGSHLSMITLNEKQNFEQALEDLQGFDRIWLVFCFHRNEGWRPKVRTPRGGGKRGVFATRSPHRPNPIGLSCVRLHEVKGRHLWVDGDLLDGTPILDIKPYVPYCDAFLDSSGGWTDEIERPDRHQIRYSQHAEEQLAWLARKGVDLLMLVDETLSHFPYPRGSNRIRQVESDLYEIACKTWRIRYTVASATSEVTLVEVRSGYDQQTLSGKKESRWDDVHLHQEFLLHGSQVVSDFSRDDENGRD